uniref:Uncharacterized protein n=3 Tax=Lygus hesperus TaxID=30085 RepID=A0A0K8T663_LYGHE
MDVKSCGDAAFTSKFLEEPVIKKEESVESNEKPGEIDGNEQRVLDESSSVGRHCDEGLRTLKLKKWKNAVKAFTEAIKIKPDDASLYTHRALAFLRLRSYQNAEADCTKALELNNDFIKAYMRRSKSRKLQNKFVLAALDLVKVMELQPEFELSMSVVRCEYDDLVFLAIDESEQIRRAGLRVQTEVLSKKEEYFGECFAEQQRWNEAIVKFTNAIKLSSSGKNPRLRDLFHHRGNCWKNLNKLNLAEADYTSAISIDDKNCLLYCKRSLIRSGMDNSSGALEDLARTIVSNPNSGTVPSDLLKMYRLMACKKQQHCQSLASAAAAKEKRETRKRLAMEERRKKLGKASELCGGVLLIPEFIAPTDLMNDNFEENWSEMEQNKSDGENNKTSSEKTNIEHSDIGFSFDDLPFVFRHKDFDEEVDSISTTDDENEDGAKSIQCG